MGHRTVRNEGSAARDHLANERTFLAWLRTALGLVGLGLVLEKLEGTDSLSAQFAGLAAAAFGALALLYAVGRYYRVTRHLTDGNFPIAKTGPVVFGGVAFALSVAAAIYLLVGG